MSEHDRQRIRAAVIEPVGGHGGMHHYDFELCRSLAAAGVAPTLATCDSTQIPEGLPFEVFRPFRGIFGAGAAPLRGLRFLRGLIASLRDARRRGALVAHFHFFGTGPLQLLSVLGARLAGRRVVITAHDVETFASRKDPSRLASLTYRLAHRVIVHNAASRAELLGKLPLPAARVDVVPHGHYLHLKPDRADRALARRRLGVPEGAQVILFFGQIKGVKGLDLLIRALPEVLARIPSVHLVVAGRPWRDAPASYERLAEELGVADRCTLHFRFVPDEEVGGLFAASEVVVCPYRRIYQSGVALMAMSFGTALIVSDLPAMRELVRDGETGFVFSSGDPSDLARVIVRVLADPEQRAAVAARARAAVLAGHSWERVGELTRQSYIAALR